MKPAVTSHPAEIGAQAARRRQSERLGRLAEWLAAAYLVATGHRILARREKTRFGEIDLIAVRRRRVAFVEVKWRRNFDQAGPPVSARQARRIASAAEAWLWQHPALRDHEIGLDCMQLAPGRLPRYYRNLLQPV